MVQRVHLSSNPPRLITSKAGKNATPTMADAEKSFDSNWFDGGGLKWVLTRNKSGDFTPYPYALNYIPYIWGFNYGVYDGNQMHFADSHFNDAGDRPPRGEARYIRPCDRFWYGDASQVYYATQNGIYHRSRNDSPEINLFVVFEG